MCAPVTLALAALVSACAPGGTAGTPSVATSSPAVSASAAPTQSPAPSPSARQVPCPTTPAPAPAGSLRSLGATLADWNAHHDADPDHPGWYLPGATDAPDRYTNLACTADGHVSGYTLNFKPPLTPDVADQAVIAELPADAVRTAASTGTNCAARTYASRSLAAALGSADTDGTATAVLRSITGSDGSLQVYAIALAAGPPLSAC